MNTEEESLRLFLYNCAVVHTEVGRALAEFSEPAVLAGDQDDDLVPYVSQFSAQGRRNAAYMTRWYALFHMLENDIRGFIRETLEEKQPLNWWENCVAEHIRREVSANRSREQDFALNVRSDEEIDYTTFGQLGDIIRDNCDVFGGVLSSQRAVGRVMATLNTLRGQIAHCGVLAADEVDRLKLTVKDWFRVLAGPQ